MIIYTSFVGKVYWLSLKLSERNLDDLSLKSLIEFSYTLTYIKVLNHNFPFYLRLCLCSSMWKHIQDDLDHKQSFEFFHTF